MKKAKKVKVQIVVERVAGEYVVIFSVGVQFFQLNYGGTKSEAEWMAGMLEKALSQIIK